MQRLVQYQETYNKRLMKIFTLPLYATVVVVFNVHGKQLWSCRDGQLT